VNRRVAVAAPVAAVIILLIGGSLVSCSKVEPGHVGIKVSNFGSGAGVSDRALGVGYYLTPPGTAIYEYPVYTSTYAWTASKEQADANEEISFQDKSGLGVSADVSVAYHVEAAKAPILFQKYRTDMQGIVAGPLRNAVRNAIVERASSMGVEDIYGPQKASLIAGAQKDVSAYFAPYGLVIDQLYWASNIRLPETILAQINARVANEQQALAAQATVATKEAEARAEVAEAQGHAQATQIEADALRSSPEILKQRAIEKWDGKLPTYIGANAPIPFIGGQ
jgi:regulator of protease activity HflC (stomatin/prohibitin superfamily)